MLPELHLPEGAIAFEAPLAGRTLVTMPGYRVEMRSGEAAFLIPPGVDPREDPESAIPLKNRGFRLRSLDWDENLDYSVDDILGNSLSLEIEARIKSGRVPMSILDIGGGYRSQSAGDIAREFGEAASVTNMELFHEVVPSDHRKVTRVLGDVRKAPIPRGSQDIIYSCFVFKYISPEDYQTALREVVRMLKPDGIAIIHEDKLSEYDSQGIAIDLLGQMIGAKIEPQDDIIILRKPEAQVSSN